MIHHCVTMLIYGHRYAYKNVSDSDAASGECYMVRGVATIGSGKWKENAAGTHISASLDWQ